MKRQRPCRRCGRNLSKPRLEARKLYCYRCECANRRDQKAKAHDKRIESEDFTADDYWRLYDDQGGTCAIWTCRASGKSKHLAVEHDHNCDKGHDPGRWCRACVRGLTCAQHNEWIGRSGDNPEIFDSLAIYLRYPPARRILMKDGIPQKRNGFDTIRVLNQEYRIPVDRARKIIDLSRMVGPSPIPVPDGTISVRYIREPRNQFGLYEIIWTNKIDGDRALRRLMRDFRYPEEDAKMTLNSAWEHGEYNVPGDNGATLLIRYHGRSRGKKYLFSLEEH